MKGLILFLFLLRFLFAQNSGEKPANQIKNLLYTEDIVVGVNWHLPFVQACDSGIYVAGNVLGNMHLSGFSTRTIEFDFNKPFVFKFFAGIKMSDMFKKGIMYDSFTLRVNHWYKCSNTEIGREQKYADAHSYFCSHGLLDLFPYYINSVYGINSSSQDSLRPDPWFNKLYPMAEQRDDYYNHVNLDTLPNYYRIPTSASWNQYESPYFREMSRVFYLVLFKCRVTYIENVFIDFPVPNADLDLESTDPAKRSFCTHTEDVPYYRIIKIENMEPYIPEK